MSDTDREETTATQSAASEQDTQTLTEETEGQSAQTEEVDTNLVPEKFLEKSKMDVIQAYRELEKDRGRLASELGELRQQREELEEKFKQTEITQMQQPAQPTTPQQQTTTQEIPDPLSVLDSKFDEDPKSAIKESLKAQYEALQTQTKQQWLQQQQQAANEYYWQQKKANPDFARRESAMQQLANQFQHLIKPEYANSADMIKALDLMSRGMDIDHYKKAAVEEAQKRGASVLEEKRRAQSESSNSEGDRQVDLSQLSDADYLRHMEKLYGHSDK